MREQTTSEVRAWAGQPFVGGEAGTTPLVSLHGHNVTCFRCGPVLYLRARSKNHEPHPKRMTPAEFVLWLGEAIQLAASFFVK